MLCEICNTNEAIFHVKQIIGKDELEMHLCESCARLKGISKNENNVDFSISQLLTGLVDIKTGVTKTAADAPECSQCGFTLARFRKTGRLGCAECYVTFSRQVRNYIQKMYGQVQHRGKFPGKLAVYKNLLFDVEALKDELKKAIGVEDYERAAMLRDRIREMTEKVDTDG
jgi:protein arginine kinase activator